jgi:hypothetical protein
MQEPVSLSSSESIQGDDAGDEWGVGADPHRPAALILAGGAALLVWLAVVIAIPPHRLLTYLAFFVPFWVFVASSTAAGLYWFASESQESSRLALKNAVRRGAIVASLLVANLALLAAHRWQPVSAVILLGIAGAVELAGYVRAARTEALAAATHGP